MPAYRVHFLDLWHGKRRELETTAASPRKAIANVRHQIAVERGIDVRQIDSKLYEFKNVELIGENPEYKVGPDTKAIVFGDNIEVWRTDRAGQPDHRRIMSERGIRDEDADAFLTFTRNPHIFSGLGIVLVKHIRKSQAAIDEAREIVEAYVEGLAQDDEIEVLGAGGSMIWNGPARHFLPQSMSAEEGFRVMNNPPWADRALDENWEAIEAALASQGIPEEWMPRGDLAELGCGHYGCVYPTSDPKIVFKLTTDVTEASFVANYLKLRDKNVHSLGVVQYYEIFALQSRHRSRAMFALWREEVSHVECPRVEDTLAHRLEVRRDEKWYGSYESREFNTFTQHLMKFKNAAHEAKRIADRKAGSVDEGVYFDWVKDQLLHLRNTDDLSETQVQAIMAGQYRYPYKFALLFQQAMYFAQIMGSEYYGVNIGEALETYMNAGLFLADVHCGNIGLPDEEELDGRQTYAPIITDPGHSIALNRDLAHPRILTLEA